MRGVGVGLLVLLSTSCGWRQHGGATSKPSQRCLDSIAVLHAPTDTTRRFERIGSTSISCERDCEGPFKARACELGADAVLLAEPRVHPGARGAVVASGSNVDPLGSPIGRRDEQGQLIGRWQPPSRVQDGVFLRWQDEP
jgi:hypothetical protein